MRQKLHLLLLAMLFLAASCHDNAPDEPTNEVELDANDRIAYIEKQTPVNRGGADAGTVTLRFYADLPDVAYVSLTDFHKMMLPGSTATVNRGHDGLYTVNTGTGSAVVDTHNETLTSSDYLAFTNMMSSMAQPGMPNTYFDNVTPYVRFGSLTTTAQTLCLDYAPYGIDLRGDGTSVYAPLSTLSDLYSDLQYHRACYNGIQVVVITSVLTASPEELVSDYFEPLLKDTRSETMAEFAYHNLCFTLDHYYGYPGRAVLDASMRTMGLDAALTAQGTPGEQVKRLLRSTNTYEYLAGMTLLHAFIYDGGHSYLDVTRFGLSDKKTFLNAYTAEFNRQKDIFNTQTDVYNAFYDSRMQYFANLYSHRDQRNSIYGKGVTYLKYGNTAVCEFDSFLPTGSEGIDQVAVFLDAIDRAEADPEVQHFIIDVSNNTGGSADIVALLLSLTTGRNYISYENTLTHQRMTVHYDVDRNRDGAFDARDAEVTYHFDFAVLTSSSSFSCGNLFPSAMKDAGVLIIGERSGGGACAVQMMQTADGYTYQISSHRMRLINAAGQIIDDGIEPDVPIALEPGHSYTIPGTSVTKTVPDFTNFYDLKRLDQIMNTPH
ncbi:MAG: hypothetical protein IJT30_11940 [Muribaculaceae bacterium]|nr:hypothetical protein [Muribaculaceae bacterium]